LVTALHFSVDQRLGAVVTYQWMLDWE
jgi:hypothetical protein